MKDVVLNAYAAFKVNSEGATTHLYVDTQGWVSIGIGVLYKSVDHAKSEFKKTKSYWEVLGQPNTVPTEKMIEDDYNACLKLNKELGGNVKSRAFAKVTQLRLTQAGVLESTKLKMKGFENTLWNYISKDKWAQFPADAQFACIAMMWGPGVWKTIHTRYPKMAKAIEEEDFATAAKEVAFKSNGNQKLRDWLNKSYRFLLSNAAAVMPKDCRKNDEKKTPEYMMNPNLIYWPSKWESHPEEGIALEVDWMEPYAPGKGPK